MSHKARMDRIERMVEDRFLDSRLTPEEMIELETRALERERRKLGPMVQEPFKPVNRTVIRARVVVQR